MTIPILTVIWFRCIKHLRAVRHALHEGKTKPGLPLGRPLSGRSGLFHVQKTRLSWVLPLGRSPLPSEKLHDGELVKCAYRSFELLPREPYWPRRHLGTYFRADASRRSSHSWSEKIENTASPSLTTTPDVHSWPVQDTAVYLEDVTGISDIPEDTPCPGLGQSSCWRLSNRRSNLRAVIGLPCAQYAAPFLLVPSMFLTLHLLLCSTKYRTENQRAILAIDVSGVNRP